MSIFGYHMAYLIGFKPWDRGLVPEPLTALVEGKDALAPGRALDLGCGMGTHAIYLARLGWQVTAVDIVDRALREARRRGREAGVAVDWVKGDVTRLPQAVGGAGFTLLFDLGCFHGLSEAGREGYAHGATAVATHGAHLLLLAFVPGRRGPMPRGVSREEVKASFGGWDLRWTRQDPMARQRLPRYLADADPTWYLLTKR